MSIKDDIKLAIAEIKERDPNLSGPFKVAPVINKHCFIPCQAGYCNCRVTVEQRFCVVIEDAFKRALDDANQELGYLNELVRKEEVQKL